MTRLRLIERIGAVRAAMSQRSDDTTTRAVGLFQTKYRTRHCVSIGGEGEYGEQIYATDQDDLRRKIEARGLGEQPCNWPRSDHKPASVLVAHFLRGLEPVPRPQAVFHALLHLAHMAAAAGVSDPYLAMEDDGWLHQAVHRLRDDASTGEYELDEQFIDSIRAIEAAVPGMTPES